MEGLRLVLFVLGVGFLVASLRLFGQLFRFHRMRGSALLTWAAGTPPFYRLMVVLAAVLSVLIFYKLVFLQLPPGRVFGESMMLLYYGYAMPLSLRIRRGFYGDGIWADGGFVPYSRIGGLSWREGEPLTLVILYRMRSFARTLAVPTAYYGAARRLLRDKIAAQDIQFTSRGLDLGLQDGRDVV